MSGKIAGLFNRRNGNGLKFTIKEVKDFIKDNARDYIPMFPNTIPFFKLIFELSGWKGDHTAFIKPPICAIYIKQYIYARFDKDILPRLIAKDNPIIRGYIRKYKLFQFLNDEGIMLMKSYIDDAIKVMEHSKNMYDFETEYCRQYKLSLQLKLLPNI